MIIIAGLHSKYVSSCVRPRIDHDRSHWPNCNWCSTGSNHFASPNSTDNSPMDGDDGSSPNNSDDDDPYYQESIQDMPGDDEYLVDGMIRFNWSNASTYLDHPYRRTVRKRSMPERSGFVMLI